MRGILYDGGPNALWVFLLLTIVIGGAAALATGRTIARGWRPLGRIAPAMLILAGAVCFLHYALFGESTIPLADLWSAASRLRQEPTRAVWDVIFALHYLITTFLILLLFGAAGHRATRAGQMARQYPFVVSRRGAFGWSTVGASEK